MSIFVVVVAFGFLFVFVAPVVPRTAHRLVIRQILENLSLSPFSFFNTNIHKMILTIK